ncbi:hypothetical protein ABT297_20680 [Dactylosporangium sp. NPDC000555]|uniref:hypothetical protein n=1 Tax=Dactylosporangium sp. NPDC000555 TaxID=3154260 RepID=UPI00332A3851
MRGRDIRWDDLVADGPPAASRWTVSLRYGRSGGRPKRFNVRVLSFYVDYVFFATVVRHYAEHPEHRTAIGTQRERERLESAYAEWRSGPASATRLA